MPAINVTAENGTEVSGLTPGSVYSIWTEGGPWLPHGGGGDVGTWIFQLSTDRSSWGLRIGTSYDPVNGEPDVLGVPSDLYVPIWATSRQNLDSVHVLITFTASGGSIYIRVGDLPSTFSDNGGSLSYEIGAGPLPFCEYGTSVQGSLTGGIIVTTALIDVLLTGIGAPPWLTIIFDAFIGKTLWGGDLCAGLPPLMPQFTNADFLGGTDVPNPASLGKFWQALQAIAWPHFCQCNPAPIGSPPPIVPPVPTVIAPAAAPAGPIQIDCDSSDVCALLNQLARQLTGMSSQIAQLRSDVTLIQRQNVPFAYIPGTLHTGLTGSGQFAVQGLLGLAIQITTVPGASGEAVGDPVARFGLGWVTTGNSDGWRMSTPLRHNPEWVDVAPSDTLVGYSLESLVVANIQEFRREP